MGKGGEEWEEQTNVCSNAKCMWPGPFHFLSGMHNDDDLTDATHTIGYCVGVGKVGDGGGICLPARRCMSALLGSWNLELELCLACLLAGNSLLADGNGDWRMRLDALREREKEKKGQGWGGGIGVRCEQRGG